MMCKPDVRSRGPNFEAQQCQSSEASRNGGGVPDTSVRTPGALLKETAAHSKKQQTHGGGGGGFGPFFQGDSGHICMYEERTKFGSSQDQKTSEQIKALSPDLSL